MLIRIWPDGAWAEQDDSYAKCKSDDYQVVMVHDNATDEEIDELAASVHKHGYVTPEALNAFNLNH